MSLLPFPKLIPLHGKGCPFSVDIIDLPGAEAVLLALSLPPIVKQFGNNKYMPIVVDTLEKSTLSKLFYSFLFGPHILLFVLTLLLFIFQIYISKINYLEPDNWLGTLNSWLPNLGSYSLITFILYLLTSYKRWIRETGCTLKEKWLYIFKYVFHRIESIFIPKKL